MKTPLFSLLIVLCTLYGCKTLRPEKQTTCTEDNVHGKVKIVKMPLSDSPVSSLSGVVNEFESNFAIVDCKLILWENEKMVKGCVTDENGHFMLDKIDRKQYRLDISAMGFETMSIPLDLTESVKIKLAVELKPYVIQVEKPIIYLYPESTQSISVQLDFKGKLRHTYPAYPTEGWHVTAAPDGTIWDEKGQTYYALFWEGQATKPLTPQTGFVVEGKETATFLEEKLAYLGLNRREANEFIMYWLPRMQDNPYNLIHFAGEAYDTQAPLMIHPQPTTLIRVMMLTKPLQTPIDFPLQDLQPLHKTRKGFTVVEWGGSEWKEEEL